MKTNYIILYLLLIGCNEIDKEQPFEGIANTPTVLDWGNISTNEFHESVNYISEDGSILYFTRSNKGFETSTLYSAQFVNGKWEAAKKMPFSGSYYDAGLHFTSNENRAFFTSKRNPNKPNLSEAWNIWSISKRQDGSWGEPDIIPPPINSTGMECCLTMNKKGETFFSSDRDGSWDIYQATYRDNKFINVKKLNQNVNSKNGEWPSYINEKGDLLLISSIRKTGLGGDDVYLINKENGDWGKPILLDTTINSSAYEDSPILSHNGKYFLFSSWKNTENSEKLSNIYCIESEAVLKNVLN
ncbi:hypothetical protein [Spongiimicrobium sp. 3-5]|uniref:hypothetical protein n=1 Tax=Spongiimicrobium sp. 3-5 TaxID=3332596 RepID=UPI00397F6EF2